MSFNTALSGLNAAQADLSVTSNNIANVNTTGFKESRAEFGDIYAISALGSGRTAIGAGVLLSNVAQQFNQGNLNFTSNTLDLAVSGEGFFVLAPNLGSAERIYTRAGAFGVDENGNVVNAASQVLQVFPVNPDGSVSSTSLSGTIPLQLPQCAGSTSITNEIEVGVNLPSPATALWRLTVN
jgi:flagellar hook protein FlgE